MVKTGVKRVVKLSTLRSTLKKLKDEQRFISLKLTERQISNIEKTIKLKKQGFRIARRPKPFTSKAKALEAIKKATGVTEKFRLQVTTKQFIDPKTGRKIFIIVKKPN